MKLLSLLVVCCALPAVVLGCSCVEGSSNRPPVAVIRDAFREENNANIYSAIVIGAVCNCVVLPEEDFMGPDEDTNVIIHCRAYSLQEDDVVASSLVSGGVCDSEPIRACVDVERGLAPGLNLVADINTSVPLLTDLNTESGGCFSSCPFNSVINDVPPDVLDYRVGSSDIQPCYYSVRVTEVFKGALTNGTLLNITGPDVLTSCGSPGRNLQIGEEYVAGIGGPCSSIREWTLLSDSVYDVDFLRDPEAGRNSLLALLVILLPSLIVAVSLAVTGCVYYRHRRGALKKAPQSSDNGRMLSEVAEKGDAD